MLFPKYHVASGATFSPCEKYRYVLWRVWNPSLPKLGGLLLNPSTATATVDDPTVFRMGQRARHMGFGGLVICNIFAWRSTNPDVLYELPDPVGPENSKYILQEMKECGLVICGWGKHGALMNRGAIVCAMMRCAGIVPHALKVNGDGTPCHPLYLPYSLKPEVYAC